MLPVELLGGKRCTGLCGRDVGVVRDNVEGGFDRRVGTAVCVEVVDVEVIEGLGDAARSGVEIIGTILGVAVRLEEVDAEEGFGEMPLSRCLSRSIPETYSECNLSTARTSCFLKK